MVQPSTFSLILLIFGNLFLTSECNVAISIDLGSESMKVAVVMHRTPMDVALNSESKRKTPTALGFRDSERLFGRAALNLATRTPGAVFECIPLLIGKTMDHPVVDLYRDRYPYHNITYDDTIGQLVLTHPNGMSFTVDELVAMLLEHAKEIAEHHTQFSSAIKSAVITVPNYFGQAERRSLIRAAELAGLEVLQLINSNTATALNFGVFRYSLFNATAQHFMFFDLGHMSTTATVVSYHVDKHIHDGVSTEGPILTVLGVGTMPTLGTSTLIFLLRAHLAQQFQKANPNLKDIQQNNRVMSKLLQEASRVFTLLSANNEVMAQIEGLLDDVDLHIKVSREQLLSIGAKVFDQFRQPFIDALKASKLDISEIREIVLMGGGTRVPKVQSMLTELGQRSELGKGINNDEAAVMGAIYLAAARTPGFRVVHFTVRDYNPYPISVNFERVQLPTDKDGSDDASNDNATPHVQRILFSRGNPYPQKRAITFNRHSADLTFHVNYVELEDRETRYLGTSNLSRVTTKGVTSVIEKHKDAELRGIKAHFMLDPSGLLVLTSVDCIFHPKVAVIEETKDESAFQKLGSTISGFFGGNSESATGASEMANDTLSNNTESGQPNELNETISEPSKTVNVNETKTVPKKLSPISERLLFDSESLDSPIVSKSYRDAAISKLKSLRETDQAKRDLEHAMNELESILFTTRDNIESESFIKHATKEELSDLAQLVSTYSDWYEEQGPETIRETFDEKHGDIRKLLIPIEFRISEAKSCPVALKKLEKAIGDAANFSQVLKDTMEKVSLLQNSTEEKLKLDNTTAAPKWPSFITEAELTSFDELIEKAKSWLQETTDTLTASSPAEKPPILTSEVLAKQQQIQREIGNLNRKMNLWKSEVERIIQQAAFLQSTPVTPTSSTGENQTDANDTSRTLPPESSQSTPTVETPPANNDTDADRDEL